MSRAVRSRSCLRPTIPALRHHAVTLFLALLIGMALIPSARSQTYTESLLYSFTGGSDGSDPYSPLVLDSALNVYGTTVYGGAEGAGMAFEISPLGKEIVLANFSYGGLDGGPPGSGLLLINGKLFGTTTAGGTFGQGVVYQVVSPGKQKVLYNFRGGTDGATPSGALAADAQGNLYGTTANGGKWGFGTLFRLAPTGIETIVHNFGNDPDGQFPLNGIIRDSAGNVYGTTSSGGKFGWGTIFRISASGQESILFSFANFVAPTTVVRDSAGNLYGTTTIGGSAGYGTVYKLDTTGKLTVLHTFHEGDGEGPYCGVVRDSAGNLYGTTYSGGAFSFGTVFKVDATGAESILYSFQVGSDGAQPLGPVVQDSSGNLYGTTKYGGAYGGGAVFKLKVN